MTEGALDFEYKKYLLLAYLQEINNNFNQWMLYPFLSDLLSHYQNLTLIRDKKQAAANQFPKQLSKLDFEKFKLEYENLINDDAYLEVIQAIVDYAIPRIETHLKDGKEIHDQVEEAIEIYPIGIEPLHKESGYMFLTNGTAGDTAVYGYTVTLFEAAKEKYRGIKTDLVTTFSRSITKTYETVKMELIRQHKDLPNPATYAVECHARFPLQETLLPIAKRSLVRLVCTA
jgi:hypothetical protein